MPKQLLYEFQIPGLLVDDCRCRVPEGVKSRCPASARNSKTIQYGIKDIPSEDIGVERRTVFLAEDKVVWLIVIRVVLLRNQSILKRRPKVDSTDTSLRFR